MSMEEAGTCGNSKLPDGRVTGRGGGMWNYESRLCPGAGARGSFSLAKDAKIAKRE